MYWKNWMKRRRGKTTSFKIRSNEKNFSGMEYLGIQLFFEGQLFLGCI